MTDKIFVDELSEVLGETKVRTKEICYAIEGLIKRKVSDNSNFKFADIMFSVKDTAERNGFNPSTGEKIVIPAGKKVSLRASKGLKEIVK